MKIKFLEKGIVFLEAQYDLDDKSIKRNKDLSKIIDKYKKGKALSIYEKMYLYREATSSGKLYDREIIEYPNEYIFEQLQDYEE